MGAKFCCCIPVRVGVLLLSLLQFLFSGAVTVLSVLVLINKSNQLSHTLKTALIIVAAIEGIMAMISLAGFIGAVAKKHGAVKAYSIMLNVLLVVQIAAHILFLYAFFTESKSDFVKNCINGSTDQAVIDECNNTAGISKPAMVVSTLISLAIQGWFCWICAAYAKQLKDRNMIYDRAMKLDTSSEIKYERAKGHSQEVTRPLTTHTEAYQYAEPTHSYGNKSTYGP